MGYKNLQFDKDSVFLVTGGAGFIGSNLCEAILDIPLLKEISRIWKPAGVPATEWIMC